MNRFKVDKTIISRIFAATGVLLFVAVFFFIAFEKEEAKRETEKLPEAEEILGKEREHEFKAGLFLFEKENLKVIHHSEVPGEVSFGSMAISIPGGWTAEERMDEEGFNRCVLVDNHSESEDQGIRAHHPYYEHEIEILPYQVLQFPEDQLAFLYELMHYFGFQSADNLTEEEVLPERGTWLLASEDSESHMREYLVCSRTESGGGEIFKIRESEYVSLQEGVVESLQDYLSCSLITLGEDRTVLSRISSGDSDEFQIFNWNSGDELLVRTHKLRDDEGVVDTAVVSVFDANTLDMVSEFYRDYYAGAMVVMDIDQDGMEDFLTGTAFSSDYCGYIWNQDKREFECYSKEELLAQYGEFYLEETHEIKKEALIPERLITFLAENMQEGTENLFEALIPYECGEKLSEEEVGKIAEKNDEIKTECLAIGAYHGEGNFVKTDADNDGIEDIYLEKYTGGTLYLVDRMLFKGYGGDRYEKTYEDDGIHQDFRFIRWEGKAYLIRTTFDFDKKIDNGVYVQRFDGGVLTDEMWISFTVRDKTKADYSEVSWTADEKYRELAGKLAGFERVTTRETTPEGGYYEEEKQPTGSGEVYFESKNYPWQSDIDNDGEAECYMKYIWYPSNYGTRKKLMLNFEEEDFLQEGLEEAIGLEDDAAGCEAETLVWVDETEFGNITYVLYEDGLFDFYICGYYISPEQIEKILRVDFKFRKEVSIRDK